jgi:hypothetical protein
MGPPTVGLDRNEVRNIKGLPQIALIQWGLPIAKLTSAPRDRNGFGEICRGNCSLSFGLDIAVKILLAPIVSADFNKLAWVTDRLASATFTRT